MRLNKLHLKQAVRPGFALIITISLMILLVILAMGLLSLSSISTRTASGARAAAEARANAHIALMMALNDLQVNAGPDTRITAPSGTLGEDLPQPHLTGVWKSRKLDPDSPDKDSDLTDAAKSDDFLGWLVSGSDLSETRRQDYATGPTPSGEHSRTILSSRYSTDGSTEWLVDSIPVNNSSTSGDRVTGRLAYAVFDEGVKARMNLGIKPAGDTLAAKSDGLGSGQRPMIDRIDGLTSLSSEAVDLTTTDGPAMVPKMASFGNAMLGYETDAADLTRHFNDLTPYSTGLFTDVANGGLKRDLNLLASASASPPTGYGAADGIYSSQLGLEIPGDPNWGNALDFASLFKNRNSRGKQFVSEGSGGVPQLTASAPGDWSASAGERVGLAIPNPAPPTSPVLLPSIAKVQMAYSLHAHDLWYFAEDTTPTAATFHNGPYNKEWKSKAANMWDPTNWSFKNKDSEINYQVWVFCTPIITLHNPYNVALQIPSGDLSLEFVNVPFGMRFFVNGQAQTSDLVPYSRMFYWNDKGKDRRYAMTLYNKQISGRDVSVDTKSPIRLLPGEVKVFSPYMNPETRYVDRGDNEWYNVYNDHTAEIRAIPGWLGEGIGYGQDQPLPDSGVSKGIYSPLRVQVDDNGRVTGNGRMMQDGMVLTGDENIHVEFAPVPDPSKGEKRFTIEMTLKRANRDRTAHSMVLDFDYEVTDGLQRELLGENGTIRWPSDGTVLGTELRDHWNTPLADFQNITPFALLSAYAKTTHGGVDSSSEDGRYPAKPWVFNNHAGAVLSQKVITEHPSHHSHEINLQRLPGHTEEAIDIQPDTDRGSFVTGHTVFNGRRFGTMLDVPLGPIQSPVSLNGACLAAGYHLPRFTAPIGNSFAHPAMSSDMLIEDVNGSTYADHCYLLNSVLFDGFYCSGFQTRGGFFDDASSVTTQAEDFFLNNQALADPRLTPYVSGGATREDAVAAVTESDAYRRVAAYQMNHGAFNVNSTSVDAWKAVLSSLSGEGAAVSSVPVTGGSSEGIKDLAEPDEEKGARFSRFRLPNLQPDSSDPDALWHASRDLSADELDRLATEIVRQVRDRGPFLSMGEFVNRRIGASSQNTLVGALQAAIDNADLNDAVDFGGFDIQSGQLADLELRTPDALLGPSAQGAPGALTQGDILSALGNAATVRSDTFVIRGYGESVDEGGSIRARAWCEAVVQRIPDYVDPLDAPEVKPEDLTSEANKQFGRRFQIVSFRWLNSNEV